MAVRYSQIINNQEGLYFRAEIHDADFVGTASDYHLANIEFDYKGQNNQRWDSIWSSQVTLAVQSTTAKDLTTLIDDIKTSDEGRFSVKVYKSTDGINYSFYWLGLILTDLSMGADEAPVQHFEINATDGLGSLKGIDYADDPTTPFGTTTVIEHITNALKMIPTAPAHYSATDVFIVSDVAYFEEQMPSLTGDPANWVNIAGSAFYEVDKNEDYQFKSCYEVVELLCLYFNARLFFIDGRWNLIEIRTWETQAAANYHKYQYDGTLLGTTESYSLRHTIDGTNAGTRLATQSFEYFPPLRKLEQKYFHGTAGNLLRGKTIDTSSGLQSIINVPSGAVLAFKGLVHLNLQQSPPYVTTQVFVKLKLTMKIGSTYYLERAITNQTQNNDYFSMDWQNTTGSVDFIAVQTLSLYFDNYVAASFTTPPIPAIGQVQMNLEIDYIKDLAGNDISSSFTASADLSSAYLQYIDGTPSNEYTYKAYNNTSAAFSASEELPEFNFGDYLGPSTSNIVQIWDGSAFVDTTNKWGRNTLSGTDGIHSFRLKQLMAAQREAILKRTGAFHGAFDPHKVLVFGGDYYLPLGVRFSVIDSNYDGEWYDCGNYDDSGIAVNETVGVLFGDEPLIAPSVSAPNISGTPNMPIGVLLDNAKIEIQDFNGTRKVVMDGETFNYMIEQLAIGTDTPDSDAILTLNSTTQGFLMPRMTTAQMEAISSPTPGLMVYNTTENAVYYWDSTNWHKP